MNRDELNAMLADYLGNELDAERRSAFEAALAEDPEFAAEVRSLQGTMQTLRTLDEPAKSTVAPQDVRPFAGAGLWRFAAVVAIAFVGGYLARGTAVQAPANPPQNTTQSPTGTSGSDASNEWRLRLAKRYVEHPSDSSLARSLVAFTRSTSRPNP